MDGARLRDDIVAELRAEIEAAGNPPVCLATVLVGDDKPSQIYVRSKQKKAAEAGMQSRHVADRRQRQPGRVGRHRRRVGRRSRRAWHLVPASAAWRPRRRAVAAT